MDTMSDMKHEWEFTGVTPHNGNHWYKCKRCGKSDWIASYGTIDQLGYDGCNPPPEVPVERQLFTIVYDVTNWSDTRVEQIVYSQDAIRVSCSNEIDNNDKLNKRIQELEAEVKRLKWMMTEHD